MKKTKAVKNNVKQVKDISEDVSLEMLNKLPFNIMYCDTDLRIQYINTESRKTLKSLESLLPIPVDKIKGANIDIFHKDPSMQRRLLSNPENLPHKAIISLGNEKLNLNVNAVFENGKYVGAMVNWEVVTKTLELQEENAAYKGVFDGLDRSQAVIEFKPDGTIVTANENFLKATGYALDQIVGRHHKIFCDPKYASSNEYAQFWKDLHQGEFQSGQFHRYKKSGEELWLQASYNPIFGQDGKLIKIVKLATDITAQIAKQKEFESYVELLEETANSLASASSELMATATQMASAAQQTNDQSGSVAAAAEEVSAGVQVVSTNTAQMVESIKEISKSANESAEMSRSTSLSAQETNKTIEQLGASSKEIGEVIKVISSIAQQTNLLALNATIEAARAGDAGKGFAVVANEVKELAKQTAKATQDITNKISAIQQDSERAVDAIGGISSAVDKLNSIAGAIAASVEEQTATTNEVSRVVQQSSEGVVGIATNIKVVSKAAEESSVASHQTVDASKGLAVLAERLKDIVDKVKAA